MNFDFFAFFVFMSFSSFAMAFVVFMLIAKIFGKEGKKSRYAQMILIPAVVVLFDMITFTVPANLTYFVGSLPLAAVVGLVLYSYFYKGKNVAAASDVPQKNIPLRNEEKQYSKKSARIHAARKKRGRE